MTNSNLVIFRVVRDATVLQDRARTGILPYPSATSEMSKTALELNLMRVSESSRRISLHAVEADQITRYNIVLGCLDQVSKIRLVLEIVFERLEIWLVLSCDSSGRSGQQ